MAIAWATRPCRPRGVPTPSQVTLDQPEIEGPGMNQEALQDVRVPTQMRPPHPTRVRDVRERPFDQLAASTIAMRSSVVRRIDPVDP